jgi:hypothetical protein
VSNRFLICNPVERDATSQLRAARAVTRIDRAGSNVPYPDCRGISGCGQVYTIAICAIENRDGVHFCCNLRDAFRHDTR